MLLHRLIFSKDNKDYKDYNDYNDYSDYNDYNNYNEYRYSYLDLDLDWERFSELVTYWHSLLLMTNWESWIITWRVRD